MQYFNANTGVFWKETSTLNCYQSYNWLCIRTSNLKTHLVLRQGFYTYQPSLMAIPSQNCFLKKKKKKVSYGQAYMQVVAKPA